MLTSTPSARPSDISTPRDPSRTACTYLNAVLTAIVGGHKQSQVNELLPWNWAAA